MTFAVRLLAAAVAIVTPALAADQREHFETNIRPLLAKNCWGCHRQSAMGALRLDSRETILKGGQAELGMGGQSRAYFRARTHRRR